MVKMKKILANCYIYFILFIMYLPILVLIAWSFNDATSIGESDGSWNLSLYGELFSKTPMSIKIWTALGNTLILAFISAIVSVVLGTIGAIGVFYSKKRSKKFAESVTEIPVANPEIVIALSMCIMFVFVGNYIFKKNIFGFWTLLAGHVVLALPFVYLNVKPKLQQMDPNLYEAALDLGATPNKALRSVIVPQILPGILSGFLLSITMSLDDFIVTCFTRGPGLLSGERNIETISTLIQAAIKKGPVPAQMRPLTLLIFLVVLLTVLMLTIFQNKKANSKKVRKGRANA